MSRLNTCCPLCLGIAIGGMSVWTNCVIAQITPDATLPNNSHVTQEAKTVNITGGTRAGGNLFHSFTQFSVPTDSTAYFNNAVDIENIISRVTGKSVSQIDGLIRANGTANLFLINPNGIIFGQHASLNIGGSFVATTAQSLKFADGSSLGTNPNQSTGLLTISVPLGLQFGSNQTGSINNAGNLAVKPGQNLTLIGSNVDNTGKLSATGGKVAIAAFSHQGTVVESAGEIQSLEYQPTDISVGSATIAGNINVSNPKPGEIGGKVTLLGDRVNLSGNIDVSGDAGGGKVVVGGDSQGGGVQLASSTNISSQATIKANALTKGNGGQIIVWGKDSTIVKGNLSANGGILAGNGGLIETSGSNFIDVAGIHATASATNGNSGTWLVYSPDISFISPSTNGIGNLNIFPSNGENAITTQLNAGTNVTIQANGNINMNLGGLGIGKTTSSEATLTLQSGNDITLKNFAVVASRSRLNLLLQAGNNGSGSGNVIINSGTFNILGGAFTVTATGSVSIDSILLNSNNSSASMAEPITINADSVSIKDTGINSSTSSNGNAGLISINANSLNLEENVGINSRTTGNGNSTGINITVNSLAVNDSAISSSTAGNGNAGDIKIQANTVQLDGGKLESTTFGDGNAGDVTITAKSVSLLNFFINTDANTNINSKGNAGNIIINATDNILLRNQTGLNSSTTGQGNAGSITLHTNGSLIIENNTGLGTDTGVYQADGTVVNNTGHAGNFYITADTVNLENYASIASETASSGDAGEIQLRANSLVLRNNSNIITSARSNSTGNAGLIEINAKSVLLDNDIPDQQRDDLESVTRGSGNAGEIILNADTVVLKNNGLISIDTKAGGNAGQLILTANSLELNNNSNIISGTSGSGNGGNVILHINGALTVSDRSSISVSSMSEPPMNNTQLGKAGDIHVWASSIFLDNFSTIIGDASSTTDGGNITLQASDVLVLRHNSDISTNAGTGNGGNITINTPSGFIVAVPKENSDITANAIQGKGGNVQINAFGIFGTQYREQENPFTSNITASSEFGVSGVVRINTPDIDPNRGLIKLPTNLVNASGLIDTSCNPGSKYQASSFVYSGRGGLPPNPKDMLNNDAIQVEWVSLIGGDRGDGGAILFSPSLPSYSPKSPPTRIVEASGWVVDADGNVFLVANAPKITPHSPSFPSASCQKIRE